MTKTIAIYARISLDATGESLGVQRQIEACRNLVPDGAEVQIYTDNSVSAYSGKPRPAYQDLLADIRGGGIDTLVCWASDRLYRVMRDLVELTDTLQRHGVRVLTVAGGEVDLSTADGVLRAQVMGSVAEHSSRRTGERVRAAKADAARRGRYLTSNRPYGWQRTDEAGTWAIDPVEGPIVAEGYRRFLAGESLWSISRRLQATGSRGALVTGTAWRRILRNSRNAGLVSAAGVVCATAEDGQSIVSEADYRSAVAILSDPARTTNGGPGRPAKRLLSGVAECGKCGHGMATSHRTVKGRDTYVFVCGSCNMSRSGYYEIEGVVVEALLGYLEQHRAAILAAISAPAEPSPRLLELQERLESFEALQASGAFRDEDWTRLSGPLLAEIRSEEASHDNRRPVLADLLEDPRQAWDGMTAEARRAAVSEVMTVRILPARIAGHPDLGDIEILPKS